MREQGTTWEWLENGNLKTITATRPAIKTNPRTGEEIFFNSIVAAYTGWVDSRNVPEKAVMFGNDTYLDADAMASAVDIMRSEATAVPWAVGDVLCVDNHVCMHSRNTFTPPRRILASLGAKPE